MTLFTLLPAPTASGLCICVEEEWFEVEIEPDELLLTPGLLLEHLTAGAYRACLHTVEHEATLGASRLSTPFFFKPRGAAVMFVADRFRSRSQAKLAEVRLADVEANYFQRAFAPSSAAAEQ
jgi:isopenicillin N synthase-like dioxygenase